MSSLCLASGTLGATVFAQVLHLAWTPADGVAREATWRPSPAGFEFVAGRIAHAPDRVTPPPGAQRVGDWHHYWDHGEARAVLVLERARLVRDYLLCEQGWCRPLESWLPRDRAPRVHVRPCPAPGAVSPRG